MKWGQIKLKELGKSITLPQRKADVSAAIMLVIAIKVATSPTVQ
jgi:hypothetical protein